MSPTSKALVRESRWMRVYNVGDRLLYESKFLVDGLQVSLISLINDWRGMTEAEHVEFAMAFLAKPDLQHSDEEILNYLMEVGSPEVLRSIALLTARHSDKERVCRFLARQIERGEKPLANFYQASEILKDRRLLPSLRKAYERYKAKLDVCEESDLVDYLGCCKALLAIERSTEYEIAISDLRSHSSEYISRMATHLLESEKQSP